MEPNPKSGYVGFVANDVAQAWAFSKYFSFPPNFAFYQLLHIHLSSYNQHYGASILTASLKK
jgi:hypothetical protein